MWFSKVWLGQQILRKGGWLTTLVLSSAWNPGITCRSQPCPHQIGHAENIPQLITHYTVLCHNSPWGFDPVPVLWGLRGRDWVHPSGCSWKASWSVCPEGAGSSEGRAIRGPCKEALLPLPEWKTKPYAYSRHLPLGHIVSSLTSLSNDSSHRYGLLWRCISSHWPCGTSMKLWLRNKYNKAAGWRGPCLGKGFTGHPVWPRKRQEAAVLRSPFHIPLSCYKWISCFSQ